MEALGVIGFLALVAGIIMLIVSALRKKRLRTWGIVAGVGLVAFIIGMSFSTTPERMPTSPPSTPTPSSTFTPALTSGIYSINQDVTVGSAARWKVLAVRNRGSVLKGSESRYPMFANDKVTTGRFIEVTFVVENIGLKTVTWPDCPKLVDSKGREFRYAEDYSEYVPEGTDFLLVTLQPNIPKQAIVIYEVPEDSIGLKLKVSDFALIFSKTALIDLGL